MVFVIFLLFLYFENSYCDLWSKGVVHYSVNTKDYDPHSQEVIISTLQKVQSEICVKFFSIPVNYTAENGEKVLYIHNPNKTKTCAPRNYDFNNSVVDMPVGYKCINERDIAKMVVDMLKATIHGSHTVVNSYDLLKKFHEKDRSESDSLLSPQDRNYINAHYFQECGGMTQRRAPARRQEDEDSDSEFSALNKQYYNDKAWPLGIVVYEVNDTLRDDPEFSKVLSAMRTIELDSCVMFQEAGEHQDVLKPKSKIVLSDEGADWPQLGFQDGVQTLKLSSVASCSSPGHSSHTLMVLMRILGIPMMSNRYDRDNYIRVHWKNVKKGEEMYLEKTPEAAWLKQIPYDFTSVTHAPATFLCPGCLTKYTVEPVQDHLWHRTLSMGRSSKLSAGDIKTIATVYTEQCQARVMPARQVPSSSGGGGIPAVDENEREVLAGGAKDVDVLAGGSLKSDGDNSGQDGDMSGQDAKDVDVLAGGAKDVDVLAGGALKSDGDNSGQDGDMSGQDAKDVDVLAGGAKDVDVLAGGSLKSDGEKSDQDGVKSGQDGEKSGQDEKDVLAGEAKDVDVLAGGSLKSDGEKSDQDGDHSGQDGNKSGQDRKDVLAGGAKDVDVLAGGALKSDGDKSDQDGDNSGQDGDKSGQDGKDVLAGGAKDVDVLAGGALKSDGDKSDQDGDNSGQDEDKSGQDAKDVLAGGAKDVDVLAGGYLKSDGDKSDQDGDKSGQDGDKSGQDEKEVLAGPALNSDEGKPGKDKGSDDTDQVKSAASDRDNEGDRNKPEKLFYVSDELHQAQDGQSAWYIDERGGGSSDRAARYYASDRVQPKNKHWWRKHAKLDQRN